MSAAATAAMTAKKSYRIGSWPINSTGSTDEYETDEYSPSEVSSDDDDDDNDNNNDGRRMMVANRRRRGGGGARANATPATTAARRKGSDNSSGGGGSSRARKAAGSGNSSASATGTRSTRSNDSKKNGSGSGSARGRGRGKKDSDSEIELLSTDDDDDKGGESEPSSNIRRSSRRKSTRKNMAEAEAEAEAEDSDDNYETDNDDVMEEKEEVASIHWSGRKNPKRRALGSINGNRSSDASSNVKSSSGGKATRSSSRRSGRNSARRSNESESEFEDDEEEEEEEEDDANSDSSDSFIVKGRSRGGKRQKVQNKPLADSSDDDDSDSEDSFVLGGNRKAELAKRRKMLAKGGLSFSSSGSGSSSDEDSDSEEEEKPQRRRGPAKSARDAASSARLSKKIPYNSDSDGSNSSSSSIICLSPRKKSARGAMTSQKKLAAVKKPARDSTDSLDLSDIELPQPRRSPRKRSPAPSRKAPPELQEQHDPTVRAKSNQALEDARKAREALKAAQSYKAKEVELPPEPQALPSYRSVRKSPDVEVLDVDFAPPAAAAAAAVATVSYTGAVIRLTLRYQNPLTNKEGKTNIRIKMDQPMQHLMDEFKSAQNGLEITCIKFDGQNLNTTKTPTFYDMEDEDMVDVVVKQSSSNRAAVKTAAVVETVDVHVRKKGDPSSQRSYKIKKNDPLSKLSKAYCDQYQLSSVRLEYNGRALDVSKSASLEGLPSIVYLDAVILGGGGEVAVAAGGGGNQIKVRFRINGKDTNIETISVPFRGQFASAMTRLATKHGVSVDQCNFVFDGEVLRPNSTPEGLDMESGELVDVKLPETGPAKGATASHPSARTSNANASRASNVSSSRSTSSSAAPPAMISIQTNRNQNKNPRQKTWKVTDTDPLSDLNAEYTKYYKKNKCRTVTFYFRNALLGDMSRTFRDLGIGDGDMLYAMENGKAFAVEN